MGKTQAAIPDSDLELHVGGCWAVVDEVAVRIERCDNANRRVLCVCEAEGIEEWLHVDDVEFVWPEFGYVNTPTGSLWCQRRASDGRHYRRAFSAHSLDMSRVVAYATQPIEPQRTRDVVHQLYNPSYPTAEQGFMLLRLGLRPTVALSKDVALAAWGGEVLLHIGGRCVGSLDYTGGELIPSYDEDKCEFIDYFNNKLGGAVCQ